MEHETYMRRALELAREAAAAGEVPVGCVIVREGRIVGEGRNRREEKQTAASHAEMEAIAQANAALGSWRLDGCTLYVTPGSPGCSMAPGTRPWGPAAASSTSAWRTFPTVLLWWAASGQRSARRC